MPAAVRNDIQMRGMELKVWVDGVQRIVCGVTEVTTCQEVVIALAQAIGETLNTLYPNHLYRPIYCRSKQGFGHFYMLKTQSDW